ncbi:MAG TPA: universal stress protein [Candidatus Tumulicola sp.]|jgi:nucleotide-binding universal stress UspA family protein
MFSHIIVAWDGSECARRAFEYAIEIAKRFESRLQLVSVAQPAAYAETSAEVENDRAKAHRFYEGSAASLIDLSRERGVGTELLIVEGGHPAEGVVDTASKIGADLIVVGRRGLSSGITRFLIGSISDRIARYAHCPVLLIDNPQKRS